MVQLALFTLIFTAVVYALLGLTVLARTYQRTYGWYFAVTMFGVVLWSLGDIGLLFATSKELVKISALFFYVAPMLIPLFIWMFALSFPENKKVPLAAMLAVVVAFISFATAFLFKFEFFVRDIQIADDFNIATPNTVGFLIYSAFFSTFFLFTYATFIKKSTRLRGMSRTQVQYTFYGALVASIPALATNLSLPMLGITSFIWLGPLFTLIFAVSVTAAIIRHKLFDIRLVLARSIGYILSVVSLAVVYGLLAFTVINLIVLDNSTVGVGQQVTYAVLAAGLAFTFQPVRRFFDKISNRLFYRDAYDPQVFLDQLNRVLVSSADLDHMLRETSHIMQNNLKTEFCLSNVINESGKGYTVGTSTKEYSSADTRAALKLLDSIDDNIVSADMVYSIPKYERLKNIMEKNEVAVLVRLVPSGHSLKDPVGYVMLGNKKSGNPFTNGDLRVIEIIANELVIAVENALRFQEIQNFNTTLQHRVDDATKRLRETNAKLRILDQTKDDFISMASHQLRTPLTSIKGYVSMVLEGDAGEVTPQQQKMLNQAYISSQRMVYLISDLLNVSRLKTGKFLIEPTLTNIDRVISDEVNQLHETAKGRNLTLIYNRPEHFPMLMLDETKIRQVIMNFIDNAIYYTPSGGKITITLVEKPQTIEFTVVDNGIGVPKHEQHHLFSKFYRAHNAKRARPDGTGLGLFMAKKVIVAQGGAIIFRSQEKKGSTFGFTFAKERVLPPPPTTPQEVPPAK